MATATAQNCVIQPYATYSEKKIMELEPLAKIGMQLIFFNTPTATLFQILNKING
jgi:hypothetical protein